MYIARNVLDGTIRPCRYGAAREMSLVKWETASSPLATKLLDQQIASSTPANAASGKLAPRSRSFREVSRSFRELFDIFGRF